MDRLRSSQEHAVWLFDNNTKPRRYALTTACGEQINTQCWLQPTYSHDLDLYSYKALHAQKRQLCSKNDKHVLLSIYAKQSIEKLQMGTRMVGIWLSRSCRSAGTSVKTNKKNTYENYSAGFICC